MLCEAILLKNSSLFSFTVLAHSDYSHLISFLGVSGYSAKTTPLYAGTKQQERLVTTAKELSEVNEE